MAYRTKISSPKNPLVQRVRDASAGKLPGEMVVDGRRLVAEALDAGLTIRSAVLPDETDRKQDELLARLEERAEEIYLCTDNVLQRMSSLKTPQGVLAVVATPSSAPEDLLGSGPALVVAAGGVRDPGNLGAMIRAAEAAGATGFIALRGGADPFRDKALRGSMGSALRLPILRNMDEAGLLNFCRIHGLQLIAADGNADTDHLDVDWTRPSCIVLGHEASGIPSNLATGADVLARIPLAPSVESLNVAVATGVLLFEAQRQRR